MADSECALGTVSLLSRWYLVSSSDHGYLHCTTLCADKAICHRFNSTAAVLDRHWERMVTFYRFPKAHWKHLRTSNPVESPFATVRLRTNAAKRFKKVDNATAMTWKILLVAEERFRRLDAPHLMKEVFLGTTYLNGERVKEETGRKAA